jgi:tetratricopeptide (TPR) repeat protein
VRSSFLILCALAGAAHAQEKPSATATYFAELEKLGLVDVSSGSRDTLRRELDVAEQLLREGAAAEAAVALYTIVESPRYTDFSDFVEYQNAEYYLGVSLHQAGAPGAALDALERVLRRGPEAAYYGPAHRRAVDVAIETRDFGGVLARIESTDGKDTSGALTPSSSGERAYLRGRTAYVGGDFTAAEGQFAQISKKSRLYSSALYLRGVIRARKGEWRDAAAAMCEIADTPDDDRFTFVVDERYFTVKDLARLGLGRLAHEQAEYDDAYYHYFQIPDDSVHLPDALFEAAWSMYQKRELATARDLTAELDRTFPASPVWPEAGLLAGYVELADCKFDASRTHYDKLVAELTPVVAELDRIRKSPDARSALFRRAVERWRSEAAGVRAAPGTRSDVTALTPLPITSSRVEAL